VTSRLLVVTLAAGFGAADARAVMRVFFTSSAQPYGLTNPSLALQPTLAFGTATDAAFYQIGAFPPLDAWGQTPTINWQAGEFAYIWVRFSGEANNRKLQRVYVDLDDGAADVAYYVMNDTDGANGARRWDGGYTSPDAPEFKQDPQDLLAVQNIGIINRSSAVDNWNLYDNTTRTALLGAVRYESSGLRSLWANISPPSPIPPPLPVWEWGSVNWVPEPGTLVLAALPVGFLRRRRRA
jgi:hypothetical protein